MEFRHLLLLLLFLGVHNMDFFTNQKDEARFHLPEQFETVKLPTKLFTETWLEERPLLTCCWALFSSPDDLPNLESTLPSPEHGQGAREQSTVFDT